MKKNLMKRPVCLAAAALILTLGLTAGKAMAYFTTYATATGMVPVTMGSTTVRVDEEVKDQTKHVTITNTGDYDCYIRMKALAGADYTLTYNLSESAGKWSATDTTGQWTDGGDGYYYYRDVVKPGGTTDKIIVEIGLPEWMDDPKDEDSFNVVIVAECIPVYGGQDTPAAPGQD